MWQRDASADILQEIKSLDMFFEQIFYPTTRLGAAEVMLRMQGSSSLWTVTSWRPILVSLISRKSECLSRAHLNPLSSLA